MKSLKGRPNTHCAGETWCWHQGSCDTGEWHVGVSLYGGSHAHLCCQ